MCPGTGLGLYRADEGALGGNFISGCVLHSFLSDTSKRSYCVGFPGRQAGLSLGRNRFHSLSKASSLMFNPSFQTLETDKKKCRKVSLSLTVFCGRGMMEVGLGSVPTV